MPEGELFENEPLAEGGSPSEKKLGKVSCALVGLGWGVAAFEGGTAVTHLAKMDSSMASYSLENQLVGLAAFGLGGAAAMGRFIHKQVNSPQRIDNG